MTDVSAEETATVDGTEFMLDPDRDLPGQIEALLLLAEEPMAAATLAQSLEVPADVVSACLAELVHFYDETNRGFELRHLGGGWRYYTRDKHAEVVAHSVLERQQGKLSQAALETLAVVAYSQPISRARVSAVRGVNVDGVMRTLVARGLIDESGNDPETGAVLFATTDYFLERMGLDDLSGLPELAPHLPEVDELEAELGQLAAQQRPASAGSDQPAPADEGSVEPAPAEEPADTTVGGLGTGTKSAETRTAPKESGNGSE